MGAGEPGMLFPRLFRVPEFVPSKYSVSLVQASIQKMGARRRNAGNRGDDGGGDGGSRESAASGSGSGLPVRAIVGMVVAVAGAYMLLSVAVASNTDETLIRLEQAGRTALIRVSPHAQPARSAVHTIHTPHRAPAQPGCT